MAQGYVYEDVGVGWRAMTNADFPASGVSAGTYGDATHVSVPTVNAQGIITSITTAAISGSGVTSLNALTGALSIVAGTNISVSAGGSSVTVSGTTPSSGYGTQFGGMVVPIGAPNIAQYATFTPGLNTAWGCRVVIPRTGTLNNLSVLIFTSAGNIDVGVFDCAVTTRTRLYHTGAIASPGTGWQNVGNPGLSVTVNDVLDFVVVGDSGSLALGRVTASATSASRLPAGFLDPTSGITFLGWSFAAGGATLPTTIAEASLVAQGPDAIIATVT